MHNAARAALVSALLTATTSATAGPNDIYALVDGRVLPVSGAPLERGTVLLRDGVIEAVGVDLALPPGARVIDATGLTLTPGLIDAFGSLGLPAATPRRSAGEEGAPARPAAEPLTPQASVLERLRVSDALKARDKGITTALVVGRDGVLPGRSALLALAGDELSELVWRQPAALHVHMAPLASRYPDSLMGVMALVRQALLDAERYERVWASYERNPRGQRRPRWSAALEAWQQVRARRLPLVLTALRENDVRRALALRDEFDVQVIVAGAVSGRTAELLRARKLPAIVGVNFDRPRSESAFGNDDEAIQREIAEAQAAPAALARAGVRFALGSAQAPDFLAGVRKAIEKGLARDAALRALTLDAAQILGIADRTGSLEAGKAGNVVLWQGDPLSAEAKVKLVFVDGTLFEPDTKPVPKAPAPAAAGEEDEPHHVDAEEHS